MTHRVAFLLALGAVLGAALVAALGCGKPHQKRSGPLKDWIVGEWVREDDPNWWTFSAQGEMVTTGRVPIGGSYSTEEPDKVEVVISGAGALSASMMLKVPVDPETKNLYLHFVVADDEMRPAGIESKTVFRKR